MRMSTDYNMRAERCGWPVTSGQRLAKAEGGGRRAEQKSEIRYPQSLIPRPASRAFTLIEMLIVVSIMMILVAAGVSVFRPASDSRRIREAARAINVYLSSARNRAMETGRPCGVMLRRLDSAPSAVLNLDQCEVPPCYTGDTEQSVATVTYFGSGNAVNATLDAPLPPGMVRPNDRIQFNSHGPLYRIMNDPDVPPGNNILNLTFDNSQGQMVPWPDSTGPQKPPASYRIYRAPVKGVATPLQLPASTVIDLGASGTDVVPFGNTADVTIVFAPNGSVLWYYGPAGETLVTDPIFLLVGKRERVGNTAQLPPTSANEANWSNWQDLDNIWIVINPQTGLVTTGEVAVGDNIIAARQFAQDAQSMGGK